MENKSLKKFSFSNLTKNKRKFFNWQSSHKSILIHLPEGVYEAEMIMFWGDQYQGWWVLPKKGKRAYVQFDIPIPTAALDGEIIDAVKEVTLDLEKGRDFSSVPRIISEHILSQRLDGECIVDVAYTSWKVHAETARDQRLEEEEKHAS